MGLILLFPEADVKEEMEKLKDQILEVFDSYEEDKIVDWRDRRDQIVQYFTLEWVWSMCPAQEVKPNEK